LLATAAGGDYSYDEGGYGAWVFSLGQLLGVKSKDGDADVRFMVYLILARRHSAASDVHGEPRAARAACRRVGGSPNTGFFTRHSAIHLGFSSGQRPAGCRGS
jgi:hypothetical protein